MNVEWLDLKELRLGPSKKEFLKTRQHAHQSSLAYLNLPPSAKGRPLKQTPDNKALVLLVWHIATSERKHPIKNIMAARLQSESAPKCLDFQNVPKTTPNVPDAIWELSRILKFLLALRPRLQVCTANLRMKLKLFLARTLQLEIANSKQS